MRGHDLAAHLGFLHGDRDLLLGHRRVLGPRAGDLLARQVELDRVDPVLDQGANGAAHLLGAGHHDAEVETLVRDMRRGGIAQPAHGRDLRSGRGIAGARQAPGIDEIADHDVEPGLGGRRAAPGREAGIEHQLGHLGRDQDVLLRRHHLDRVDARGVVPRQMKMRIDHARHQGRAHAVDGGRATPAEPTCTRARKARAAPGHLLDPVTLDQNFARIEIFPRAIEDADVGEQHGIGLPSVPVGLVDAVVCHRYLPWRTAYGARPLGSPLAGLCPRGSAHRRSARKSRIFSLHSRGFSIVSQ